MGRYPGAMQLQDSLVLSQLRPSIAVHGCWYSCVRDRIGRGVLPVNRDAAEVDKLPNFRSLGAGDQALDALEHVPVRAHRAVDGNVTGLHGIGHALPVQQVNPPDIYRKPGDATRVSCAPDEANEIKLALEVEPLAQSRSYKARSAKDTQLHACTCSRAYHAHGSSSCCRSA